jgi:hypothetical protein
LAVKELPLSPDHGRAMIPMREASVEKK